MQFITKQQAIIQAMTKKEKTPVAVRVYAVALVFILMMCLLSAKGQTSFQYRGKIRGAKDDLNALISYMVYDTVSGKSTIARYYSNNTVKIEGTDTMRLINSMLQYIYTDKRK